MNKLKVLDLFSGIGGFSLGLERTGGFSTVAFCEIEPFPRRVLAKHWPEVPCYDDVRTLTADTLRRDGIAVDVICGGFPCQDISLAGNGAGIADGTRSGLWSEYARLIGELRPQFVIVENVAALLSRGLDRVLGDMAAVGYDAEWHCIPASAVGAPHRRDRLWIVGHTAGIGLQGSRIAFSGRQGGVERLDAKSARDGDSQRSGVVAYTQGVCGGTGLCEDIKVGDGHFVGDGGCLVADSTSIGQQGPRQPIQPKCETQGSDRQASDAFAGSVGNIWSIEPDVGRVAHGVPQRMDRLKSLGNAVVPQIPELIGRAILEARAA